MRAIRLVAIGLCLGFFLPLAPHVHAISPRSPLEGQIVREFSIGKHRWDRGHRGIDIASYEGAQIVSPASGTIRWVGVINSIPMMSMVHDDGIITTYQPVKALVSTGDRVERGQIIATLISGHCDQGACLHFGVKENDRYIDPQMWLLSKRAEKVRLLPASAKVRSFPPGNSAEISPDGLPVAGPITSGWGPRISPISGNPEFHDGVDIGADCGSPIAALWPGEVIFIGEAGGYGQRVEVDHGIVNGHHLVSSYSHLSTYHVEIGQKIQRGQTIAEVGTTGWSTGCHLHWSIVTDGENVDPLSVIS